jgi:hypothetical protein
MSQSAKQYLDACLKGYGVPPEVINKLAEQVEALSLRAALYAVKHSEAADAYMDLAHQHLDLSEKYRALAGDFIETTEMMADTQLAQAKALGELRVGLPVFVDYPGRK